MSTELSPKKRQKRTLGIARRADLPTSGELEGVITIVQEDRFRLEDALGRGFLLTVGRRAGVAMRNLQEWQRGRVLVVAEYRGAPDLGAVAERIRPRTGG
ncbi:MAG TPA: hypothetical protein VFU47_10515 [Armatimonadota bacterium]|nr:hypothetical protein [Armatimonadota bacterium]